MPYLNSNYQTEEYRTNPIYREKIKARNRASYHKHIDKRRNESRLYRLNNKEKLKLINFRARLKYRFGITVEEYNFLLKLQNGKCGICKKLPSGIRLDVDHDHNKNVIRGLLCRSCNRFLGIIENRNMEFIGNYLKGNPLQKQTKILTRKWNGRTIFPDK